VDRAKLWDGGLRPKTGAGFCCGSPAAQGTTGLFHLAILYQRFICAIPAKTAPNFAVIDHEEWPRTPDGEFAMFTRPLDLEALLREAANRADS
jgi:hypothetical protein